MRLEDIPLSVPVITIQQDPAAPDLTGLASLLISVSVLIVLALVMRPAPEVRRRGLGIWRHLVHGGIFTSLAVALLAGYPEMDRGIQAIVGRTFLTDLAQFYGGAGLIHLPTLSLAVVMFLAYTATPLIAYAPIALADAIVAHLLSWRYGLQAEPVDIAELQE